MRPAEIAWFTHGHSGAQEEEKRKRESVSSSNVLVGSDTEDDADDSLLTGCTRNRGAHKDELEEYLALPQIVRTGESRVLVSAGVSALLCCDSMHVLIFTADGY